MSAFWNALKPRLMGAAAAGGSTFVVTHDWKAALATAASFAIYGAAHATVTSQ